jgi:hypothetical protein
LNRWLSPQQIQGLAQKLNRERAKRMDWFARRKGKTGLLS